MIEWRSFLSLPGISFRLSVIYLSCILIVFSFGVIFLDSVYAVIILSSCLLCVILITAIILFYSSNEDNDYKNLKNIDYNKQKSIVNQLSYQKKCFTKSNSGGNNFKFINSRLFSTIRAGIIIAEPVANKIIDANPFALKVLENELEDIKGHSLHEFFVPFAEDCPICNDSNEELWNYCLRSVHNKDLYIILTVSSFKGSKGERLLLETFIDISELELTKIALEQAVKQAEEANNAKSLFLASMSHEIRTPINTILGMTELLHRTDIDPEQKRYIDIARSCGQNMLGLFGEILDFSKIESGNIELEENDFDLRDVISKTVEEIALTAHKKGLEVAVVVSEDVPLLLRGDFLRLQQILANLMVNSCKFTDSGEIILEVEFLSRETENSGRLVFKVSDSGRGIPESRLDDIFDSFTQVSVDDLNSGGIGLGLSICKKLAWMMRGKISASNLLQGGAEFCFEAVFKFLEDQSEESLIDITGMKMLAAVPNIHVAKSLEGLAVKFGGNLECVYDSVELLKTVAAKHKFDVIFIDVSITELITDLLNEILKYSADLKIVLLVKLNELGSKSFQQKHPLVKAVIVKPVHELNFIETFASLFPNENYLEKKMISSKQDCFEKGTSVLLAEDNYYNRMLVRSLLEGCGIELVEVVNGAEAVEQFKVRTFSIVLMDVKMPVMDGVEAIGRIRSYEKEKQLHRTPVVAFTANVFKEDIDSYFEAGFDSTLSKPASYSQLIDVFREYCFKKGGEDISTPSQADMKISKLKLEFYEYVVEGCERILNKLIPSGDWDTVFSIAHDWKGTGSGYGYQDVTTVGDEVCLFIREGKVEQVAEVLEDFLLSYKEKRP